MSEQISAKETDINQEVPVSHDSLNESEVLLSEHLVLLNADEVPPKSAAVDLFSAVGYTAEHSVLDGHEQAFHKICLAQQRATIFLQEKAEEIHLVLSEDKGPDVVSNPVEPTSYSCGPFHDFVDGIPVCQVHRPCYCSVCYRSAATDINSCDVINQSKHDDNTPDEDSLLGVGAERTVCDSNRNTLTASADILFQNFFQAHKKLPFNVGSTSSPSEMSNTVCCDRSVLMERAESTEAGGESEQQYASNIELEDEPIFFNTLPYEIIQKIFSYLNHYQLAHTVSMVCRKWKQFGYDPIHWTALSIHRNMSSYDFACLVKRTPLLKELYLCGQCIDQDEMLFIVQSCPKLKRLDLGFVSTLHDGFISVIAEHCEQLEYLNVEGCSEFNTKCVDIFCDKGRVPKLKGINVSHCTKLTDQSIVTLAGNKEHLEILNVDGISWLSDGTLTSITKCRGQTLRALYVDGAEMSVHTVQAITTNCPRIEVLSWSFAELLQDSALLHIKQIGSLRELTLKKGMELTDEGAQILFDHKSQLKNLKKLDLSEWTNIGDSGILALTNCCGSALTHLSLCWCWNITDVGLKFIIDKCKNLIDLDLLGIDKIKGPCMVEIPWRMPHLKRLHLRQCNKIQDDLIVEIIKAMPQLKAYNYYGDEFEVQRISKAPSLSGEINRSEMSQVALDVDNI